MMVGVCPLSSAHFIVVDIILLLRPILLLLSVIPTSRPNTLAQPVPEKSVRGT